MEIQVKNFSSPMPKYKKLLKWKVAVTQLRMKPALNIAMKLDVLFMPLGRNICLLCCRNINAFDYEFLLPDVTQSNHWHMYWITFLKSKIFWILKISYPRRFCKGLWIFNDIVKLQWCNTILVSKELSCILPHLSLTIDFYSGCYYYFSSKYTESQRGYMTFPRW